MDSQKTRRQSEKYRTEEKMMTGNKGKKMVRVEQRERKQGGIEQCIQTVNQKS